MSYLLRGVVYRTKKAVTQKCQEIRNSTPVDTRVSSEHVPFLLDLFSYHPEWRMKCEQVLCFSSFKTRFFPEYGTVGFDLVGPLGDYVDISFLRAIEYLPTVRSASRTPQKVKDFKAAARRAILAQVLAFADNARKSPFYDTASEPADVDHIAPDTFDNLLNRFCTENGIDMEAENVYTDKGIIHTFENEALDAAWQDFHRKNAKLRLLPRSEHRRMSKKNGN